MGIKLPYKVLQLKKVHKTKPAYDGACVKDLTPLYKYHILETSIIKSRYTARWTQQSTAPWCLFNSFIKKASYNDVVLEHLLLEATSEGFSKEETLLNC